MSLHYGLSMINESRIFIAWDKGISWQILLFVPYMTALMMSDSNIKGRSLHCIVEAWCWFIVWWPWHDDVTQQYSCSVTLFLLTTPRYCCIAEEGCYFGIRQCHSTVQPNIITMTSGNMATRQQCPQLYLAWQRLSLMKAHSRPSSGNKQSNKPLVKMSRTSCGFVL